jgi:hypothetical protein
MTDDDFLRSFFDASLPNSSFHHRDHLRLAWLVIRRDGAGAAEDVVTAGIRRFATAHGHGDRYHETLTLFWVRLVAHAMQAASSAIAFENTLDAHPMLLDPHLPLRHWSREVLFAPEARSNWIAPDLVALPF